MPLISAVRRQRQAELFSSRKVWATERLLGQSGLHRVSEIPPPIINYKERKRRKKTQIEV